jgi:predicted DNA-binding transcriptional regulator AlpA
MAKKAHDARNASLPPPSAQHFAPAKRKRLTDEEVAQAVVETPPKPLRMIDKDELLRKVPFSFTTIWKWMGDGKFPLSRNCGGKSTWVESEIDEWISERPANTFKQKTGLEP